ncbi:MAG: ATP-binding protein [Spirochaetia bacterium]|nr:ATP-binding protein [Spirochaetia bacterium]
MLNKYYKKISGLRHSLFFKLIIAAVLIAILINFSAIIHFRLLIDKESKSLIQRNLKNYLEYIVKDLEHPPDKEKAIRISDNYGFKIRYESKNLLWQTHENMPDINTIKQSGHFRNKDHGHYKKNMYYIIDKKEGSYLFMIEFDKPPPHIRRLFFSMISILTLILVAAYLIIRKILKPVKWLSKGVKDISSGNFNTHLPETRKDEFGNLIKSFNLMTKEVQRMITLRERLLIDVSHEMRTPLARIKIALEMMKKNSKKKRIEEDVKELETMINEILETEKFREGFSKAELKPVNFEKLIKDEADKLKPIYSKVKFNLNSIKNAEYKGNQDSLRTALKNILENAFKYANEIKNPEVFVILGKKENKIIISIEDNGPGIYKKDMKNVFEPFYRTDKSRSRKTGGYGLGLSIAKKIIEAHKGEIILKKRKLGGTKVVVLL